MNDIARTPPRRSRALTWAGAAVGLLILLFLVRQVWRDWSQVKSYAWTLRPGYLLLSMCALQVAYIIMARTWRSVLRAIGVRMKLTRAFWIFYLSNLGRYIPGNVWQMGAAAVMGKEFGMAPADVVGSMIINLLYFLPTGAALALGSGGFPPPWDGAVIRLCAWTVAAIMALCALWPSLPLRLAGSLARRWNLDPARWQLATSRRLGIVLQTVAAWVCLSTGFAFMVFGVSQIEPALTLELARIYVVAHILGYVVLFAPAGLGVREGVIVALLSPLVGIGPAAGMALLARLWFTLSELLTVGVSVYLCRADGYLSRAGRPPSGV